MSTEVESPRTVRTFTQRDIKKCENDDFEINNIKHTYSPKNPSDRKRPKINSSFKKTKNISPKKENKKQLTFNNNVQNNVKKEEKKNDKDKLNESTFSRKSERHYSSKSINKKPVRHVNFKSNCLVTVIEVESYKRFNFLNTNRDNLQKKNVSCKCKIF